MEEALVHGTLVEVMGVGILLTGESGIGKSETALDLITRGHLFVADDAVIIKNSNGMLTGICPQIIRYMMDIRGLGLIDISALYGAGSVKIYQEIDLVVQLEPYEEDKDYSKLGSYSLLGVNVPMVFLPTLAGRNLAVIIEAAARNFRLQNFPAKQA